VDDSSPKSNQTIETKARGHLKEEEEKKIDVKHNNAAGGQSQKTSLINSAATTAVGGNTYGGSFRDSGSLIRTSGAGGTSTASTLNKVR
jgi:hypothetical protein